MDVVTTASQGVPAVPRPPEPAQIIRDDAEAMAVAKRLAASFEKDAAIRDRDQVWPVAEIDAFSQSGLWSINVPRAFGGPEVSYATLNRVVEIISAANSSIGQIAQNHLGVVAAIRTVSDAAQQKLLFGEVLRGVRFGNAFSEFGSKRAADFETRFTDAGDHVIVRGRKFYATGALLAHLVPIVALDDEGRAWYAIAERDAPGLTVIDDWSSFGQRTTLSGTVLIDDVRVPKTHLVPGYKGYDHPTADGAIFQIIQVAVDTGIAQAALDETVRFVRTKSRAWVDSGLEHAWEDPYIIRQLGDLTIRLRAAQPPRKLRWTNAGVFGVDEAVWRFQSGRLVPGPRITVQGVPPEEPEQDIAAQGEVFVRSSASPGAKFGVLVAMATAEPLAFRGAQRQDQASAEAGGSGSWSHGLRSGEFADENEPPLVTVRTDHRLNQWHRFCVSRYKRRVDRVL